MFAALRALWWREIVKFLRDRSRLIGALVQPLGFWILLGLGFYGTFQMPGAESVGYLEYLYPGIIALILLFTAIFSTISVVEERQEGFLQAALVAPVYISKSAFAELHPTFIGWRGVEMDDRGKPIAQKQDGSKFEVATSAYPEYEGLRSAIATHQEWGDKSDRYQRICELSKYLWSQLQNIERVNCLKDTPPEAGLVSFQITGVKHKQLVNTLEKQGFLLRTIADPDCIRACVHYLTLPEEIDRLLTAIVENI